MGESEMLMTATQDPEIVAEAVALIDGQLGDLQARELVSASEVADLLLDLRLLLATADEPVLDAPLA